MIKHKLIDHLPITGDMVSLWLPSGQSRAMDIIRGNHGQCYGTHPNVSVLPNVINPSLGWHFDGVDNYMEVPDDDSLDATDAVTISAWIKQNVLTYGTIVNKFEYLVKGYHFRVNTGGKIDAFIQRAGIQITCVGTITIETGKWYHAVFTYDKSVGSENMKIYVDGIKGGTTNDTGGIVSSSGLELRIGNYSVQWFNGYIALPFIAKSAWSVAQVNNFYLATKGLFSPRG